MSVRSGLAVVGVLAAAFTAWSFRPTAPSPLLDAPGTVEGCETSSSLPTVRRTSVDSVQWACAPSPTACNEDYLALAEQLHEVLSPRSADCGAYWSQLSRLQEGQGFPADTVDPAISPAELAVQLSEALRMEFLNESRANAVLDVDIGPARSDLGYVEQELLLHDPLVGTIHGRLLLPLGTGPWPGVLVLPGHEETSAFHRDQRFGAELPRHGLAALILDLRAYDGRGGSEHDANLALLCNGSSLMAVRVHEALRGLQVLQSDERVCADRIGLLGHSGGSATLNLLPRLSPVPRALVSDMTTEYAAIIERFEEGELVGGRHLVDEFHPGLMRLAPALNNFETFDIPVLQTPYGYYEGADTMGPSEVPRPHAMLAWLKTTLYAATGAPPGTAGRP